MVTYKIMRCPHCSIESRYGRRVGAYKVFETKNFIIMKCEKCQYKIYLKRKYLNGNHDLPAEIEVTSQ